MPEYKVVWRIELDEPSPRHAAEEALRLLRDPECEAHVFEVTDESNRVAVTVDLDD